MNLTPYTLIRLRHNSRIVAAYRNARRQASDLVPLAVPALQPRAHALRARSDHHFE